MANKNVKLITYPELHCDECGKVVHNHFAECPSCKIRDAGTSQFDAISEMQEGDIISCSECGAAWELISRKDREEDYEWKEIE